MRRQPASRPTMANRLRPFGVVAVLAIGACACGSPIEPTDTPMPSAALPTLPDVPEPVHGNGMVTDLATIVVPVQPRWTPGLDGLGMTDEWGEHRVLLEPPVPVSVIGGPVEIEGSEWYQVYVLPDATRWPSDFAAWVPAEADGASTIAMEAPALCPDATAAGLAGLTPVSRAQCFGDDILTFAARSWLAGQWVPYVTDPSWLGTTVAETRSISLFEGDGAEFPRPPDPRVAWLDARIPPEVEMPPAGVALLVRGRFNDPDAVDCHRRLDRSGPPPQPPTGGLPDEAPQTSSIWCRGQFVISSWDILLGPEGRPPVPGEAQLHRTLFEAGACGGVGMPIMRFRMDPTEPDPIWLEADEVGRRIIPVFGRGFAAVSAPQLHVIDPRGEIVAQDGTVLDPDRPFGPYAVCPMGDTVTITG